jgi:hypothetical protein
LLHNKYTLGLILIIISFLACVISFYYIIFGVPVFTIGVVFIFFSDKGLSRKLITAVTPVVLWLPASYLFLYWYGKTTPDTFLINSNFHGKFRVIYGENCGIEPPTEKGRRILRIPENGILIIKPKFESGYIDHQYYLTDSDGKMKKAYGIVDVRNKVDSFPAVALSGSGNISGPMPDGGSSSKSELSIHFSDFHVYSSDTIVSDDFKSDQRFDSLTSAIVEKCRKFQ